MSFDLDAFFNMYISTDKAAAYDRELAKGKTKETLNSTLIEGYSEKARLIMRGDYTDNELC